MKSDALQWSYITGHTSRPAGPDSTDLTQTGSTSRHLAKGVAAATHQVSCYVAATLLYLSYLPSGFFYFSISKHRGHYQRPYRPAVSVKKTKPSILSNSIDPQVLCLVFHTSISNLLFALAVATKETWSSSRASCSPPWPPRRQLGPPSLT